MHGKLRILLVGVLLIPGLVAAQNCLVLEPGANTVWTAGQAVTIRWNSSNVPAEHQMKIRLRNEANTEIVFFITPQNQNTPNTGQYHWTVDAAIAPGRYIVRVNDTQGPTQCDSPVFNILQALTVVDTRKPPPSGLPPRPDLWVYWNLPAGFQPNTTDPTTFRVGVKNLGQAGSPACRFDYTLTDDEGGKTIHLPVPRIKAGGMELLQFQYQFTKGGTYVFSGVVDPENEVKEIDESNNRLSQTLTVADDIKPDLTLVDVSMPYHSGTGSTQKVWGKVKNVGKRRSPPVQLNIKCSPNPVKTRIKTIRSLNPGDTEPFEFGFEYWTTGTKEGVIWVDMDNRVDETNEENNRLTFSFQVKSGTIFD